MNRQSAEMDGHKQVSIKRTNFSKSAEKSEIIDFSNLSIKQAKEFANKSDKSNFLVEKHKNYDFSEILMYYLKVDKRDWKVLINLNIWKM